MTATDLQSLGHRSQPSGSLQTHVLRNAAPLRDDQSWQESQASKATPCAQAIRDQRLTYSLERRCFL